jgi:hypothetical protein
MPSAETARQLDSLVLDCSRALIICDVDEVIVHFIKGFENYLQRQGLWLDPASFALNGNIKNKSDNQPVPSDQVGKILAGFFQSETATLEPVSGAVEALNRLSDIAEIVLLSNLPHSAYDARRQNLDNNNLNFPLISNEGPKGPAVARMTGEQQRPVFFIDDISTYLLSVHEYCPDVRLIHFLQDPRFAKFVSPLKQARLRTDSWRDIEQFIYGELIAVTT